MKTDSTFECGTCFFQSQHQDFTPITASADHTALECPNCFNNDKDNFNEMNSEKRLVA